MYQENNYTIKKAFGRKQYMLCDPNGKVVLKAPFIACYAPEYEEKQAGSFTYITRSEDGKYNIFNTAHNGYILTNADMTSSDACINGLPIVYTKDTANYYLDPLGYLHDLTLDRTEVFFSQNAQGQLTHDLVFRVGKGRPYHIFGGYNNLDMYMQDKYNPANLLVRLPQHDRVDNPFVPLLINNPADAQKYGEAILSNPAELAAMVKQYKTFTQENGLSEREFVQDIAQHFRALQKAQSPASQAIGQIANTLDAAAMQYAAPATQANTNQVKDTVSPVQVATSNQVQ